MTPRGLDELIKEICDCQHQLTVAQLTGSPDALERRRLRIAIDELKTFCVRLVRHGDTGRLDGQQ